MSLKKTIRVTIEKEITIEFPDNMLTPEYLQQFRSGLWPVESIDDVFKYAAREAADGGLGYEHDGLGLLNPHCSTYPKVPDVKVWFHDEDYQEEIIEDWKFQDAPGVAP